MAIPNLLNVAQAAAIIGCSEGRVRQLLIDKKLKGDKINACAWAIPRKEAERMAKSVSKVGRPRGKTVPA